MYASSSVNKKVAFMSFNTWTNVDEDNEVLNRYSWFSVWSISSILHLAVLDWVSRIRKIAMLPLPSNPEELSCAFEQK